MEVWLYEANYYGCEMHERMLLHVTGTDIWLDNEAYHGENIVNMAWTKKFWDELGEEDKLTRICKL